jgi:hypothetical protein
MVGVRVRVRGEAAMRGACGRGERDTSRQRAGGGRGGLSVVDRRAGRGGAARVGGRPRAPGERMDDAPPRVFRPVGFLALRHQQQWMDGRQSVFFSTLVVANDGHGADMLY